MIIPNKLKILGHEYLVSFEDPEKMKDCGEQNHTRNTLRIRNDLPQSQQEETLIHEILHAINPTYIDGDAHAMIEFWAQGLYCILKENDLLK